MDKKVSIKNIDKIIKNNRYEEVEVSYPCGEEEVTFSVIPCADFGDWYGAIESATSILSDKNGKFRPSLISAAYGYALVSCFTNIKTDNANKIIELTMITDIVDLIEDALPGLMLKNFKSDFAATVRAKETENSPWANIIKELNRIVEDVGSAIESNPAEVLRLLGNGEDVQ